jgi:hypothetical protein
MKHLLPSLLALLSLGLSLALWSQHAELVELRARQQEWRNTSSAAEKRLAGAEANVRELEKQLAEARHPVMATKSEAGALAGNGRGQAGMEGALDALMPRIADIMDRPAMQKMVAAQVRNQVERRFKALFKQLNLSPEETEKLKSLLMDRESTAMDTMMLAAQKGLNPIQNQEEIQKLISAGQAEADEQIKQLLGGDGYQTYVDYRTLEPQRNTVAQLQQSLGYTDAPLNASQAEQLTRLLASSATPKPGTAAGTNPPRNTRAPVITDQVVESSRSFLSPTQVQGLADLKAQQEAMAAARKNLPPVVTSPGPGQPPGD